MAHSNNVKPFVSGVQKKYEKVQRVLRTLDRRELTQEESEDLAYRINYIESYGFKFHPNLYVWDEVDQLGKIAYDLLNKQKEKSNA